LCLWQVLLQLKTVRVIVVVKFRGRHYLKLPVEVRPADPGVYRSTLRLNLDTGEKLTVELFAEIDASDN
jgi:hypothetical protein